MRRARTRMRTGTEGFTLLEMIVAVALMGIIMSVLATVTAQWLPNWSSGLLRVQRNEQLATALDRLVLDLGAAEYVSARELGEGLFDGDGSTVTFVRSTLGPNEGVGLEYVRISEVANNLGRTLVRARTPFAPFVGDSAAIASRVVFADPVVLLREPYRIVFAYTGLDGIWKNSWHGSLPQAIRLSVLDTSTQRLLPISTAVRPHVTLAAPGPEQTEAPSESRAGEERKEQ